MAIPRSTKKIIKREAQWLYAHLNAQFNDLPGAMAWYAAWKRNGQQILGFIIVECTQRSMASHCSNALEGKLPDLLCSDMGATKYGEDIYWSPEGLPLQPASATVAGNG